MLGAPCSPGLVLIYRLTDCAVTWLAGDFAMAGAEPGLLCQNIFYFG